MNILGLRRAGLDFWEKIVVSFFSPGSSFLYFMSVMRQMFSVDERSDCRQAKLACLFVCLFTTKVMLSNMCSMQFTVVLLTTFSLIDVFAGLGTLGYIFYVCWWSWPYLSSRNAGRPKSSRTTSRRTTKQITTAQTTTATRKKRPHEGRDGDAPPLQQQKH